MSSLAVRFGKGIMMVNVALFTGYLFYDRLASLPEPFKGLKYDFYTRFMIRTSRFCNNNVRLNISRLYSARQNILRRGYGSASPEATQLFAAIAKEMYQNSDKLDPRAMRAMMEALFTKPHVGEGEAEERTRIEAGLKLCIALSKKLIEMNEFEDAQRVIQKALTLIDKCPPYLSFRETPEHLKLLSASEAIKQQ